MNLLLVAVSILSALKVCFGSRILYLVPMPARSHYNLGEKLVRELSARGHEVTIIAAFSMANRPGNVREIIVPDMKEKFFSFRKKDDKEGRFSLRNMTPWTFFLMAGLGEILVDGVMNTEEVKDLMKSDESFDLIMGECFLVDGLMGGFSHRFKAPVIFMTTFMPNTWATELIGNPAPSAYVPEPILPYTEKMTFGERATNFIYGTLAHIVYYKSYIPSQDRKMRHYFGEDTPYLQTLTSNTSLVLVNHHYALGFPRPMLPNMIEIGGFHVNKPKPLPKDLQTFMDNAKDGVIFFSLGSNLLSSELPEDKFQAILKAFSQLKQKVLWKFEKEATNLPKNVKISKWLPQSDILAHPNLKLFISHGGILSITESVLRGVPIVAIPIFGDQPINSKFLKQHGCGVVLDYDNLSEGLSDAINEALNNPMYARNMKLRSTLLQDLPMSQINTALYWVEYVIRYKGAPHLRSAAQDLAWYQLYLLDVYAFLGAVLFIGGFCAYKTLKLCVCKFCCKKKTKSVPVAKKNK